MKSHKKLYDEIISLKNLILAWRNARKGKTKKEYIIEFEKETRKMRYKINLFNKGEIDYECLFESFQGWNAYAEWANSKNAVEKLIREIRISQPHIFSSELFH